MRKLFLFLFVIFFISFIGADSISINPGGEQTGISVNPYIQPTGPSSFSCTPLSCSIVGANCDVLGDGCGGIISCGTCDSGYSCNSGICVVTGTTPGGTTPSGGGGSIISINNVTTTVVIIPTQLNLKMAVNTSNKQIIKITNNGNVNQTFSITQENLSDMIIIRNVSLTVSPGETKELEVIFVSSEQTGIFTGKINIGNYQVSVNLEVKTNLLLFDSNIIVLTRGSKVSEGKPLKTKVTLVPMGDKERTDVNLNYIIKDANGEIYFTHSETVLVQDRMDLYRDFDIGNLPLGKYVINLELVYPGGKAPSSAQFEIVKQTAQDFLGFVMFTLIVAMIMVSIIIVGLSILSRRKR